MTDALDALAFVSEASARGLSRTFKEPDWLLAERLDAVRRFQELPAEVNPLFTLYLDLRMAKLAEIDPYTTTGDALRAESALPAGASGLLEVREDSVVARSLSPQAEATGVVLDTFANVLTSRPELLREVIEDGRSLPATDKFAQLSRAMSVLGVFVHIPAGVDLPGPIVVRWLVGQPGRGLLSRTVVSVGAGAHASLLEEQGSSGGDGHAQSLWTGTMEVHLGAGATLDVAGEQDFGPSTIACVNRHARVERDATLRWALASVGGQMLKSRIDNELVGRGASVRQAEIGFGGGSQLFDLTSYTRHIAEDTTGDLLSKGVFQERARGYFKGLIEIRKTARGTDSYLGEFAMLLARKARSVAIPSLEIDQPDVRRASHSSSVGPIDEAEIFYLMSRGIPRDLARKFIVLGFLEPVVSRIPLPEAQERLRGLLDRKWAPAAVSAAPAA